MRIAVIDDERPARGELIWQLRELLGDVDFAEGGLFAFLFISFFLYFFGFYLINIF